MSVRRVLLFFITLLFVGTICKAQGIQLTANNEPLNVVIKRLNVEVSFDNAALSKYRVTVSRHFSSAKKAISYLIAGKPFRMEIIGGVYIISSKRASEKKKTEEKQKSSVIAIKQPPIIRRHKVADTLDTSRVIPLEEVTITSPSPIHELNNGESTGSGHFNYLIGRNTPGFADNMIFNVLRLMPGIRASGEPSDELYVWGSSPGESRIMLDGIPLFAMQSINNNISYINPYMAGDVVYKRGQLSVTDPSQVGAVVNISSSSHQLERASFKAMLGTMSLNLFGSAPISKRSTLSVAYRHTLNGLFKDTELNPYRKGNNEHGDESTESGISTVVLSPDYHFQDVNINLTGSNRHGDTYKITAYGANDYMEYESDDTLNIHGEHKSYQAGISGQYLKKWNNGNVSKFSTFYSGLYSSQDNSATVNEKENNSISETERLGQCNIKYEQNGVGRCPSINLGGEVTVYHINNGSGIQSLVKPSLFMNKVFALPHLSVDAGIRTDFVNSSINIQPRVVLKYNFLKYFSLSSSWGIYHQYLVKDPYQATTKYYQFHWDINSALKSYNTIAGLSFDTDWLNVTLAGFWKTIKNSDWIVNQQAVLSNFDIKGFDVSTKVNFSKGVVFASWSLSNDPRQAKGTTNEVKVGSIVQLSPFSISANYIYGKGYNPQLLQLKGSEGHNKGYENSGSTYSRMDVSASYSKQFKSLGFSTGISVINLFDKANTKFVTTSTPKSASFNLFSQTSRRTFVFFIEFKI